MKTQISTLTIKVENFNVKICSVGGQDVVRTGGHLKDMLDLNTELIGYLSSLTDNVNVRDLFDFLTICYCEYDHFFKDHRREITSERQQRTVLLPLAYDIVFSANAQSSKHPDNLTKAQSCEPPEHSRLLSNSFHHQVVTKTMHSGGNDTHKRQSKL